jgi:hypothetical protein
MIIETTVAVPGSNGTQRAPRSSLAPPATRRLTIHADKLFDGERLFWDQTVVVEGGRIVTVAPAGHVGSELGALRSAFVMPGLISTHEHVRGVGMGDSGLKSAIANVLALFLRYGVTTIRDAGTSLNQVVLIERMQPRPRIVHSGPLLEEADVVTYDSVPIDLDSCRDVVQLLAQLKSRGIAFAKVYVSVGPQLCAEVIEQAHAAGLKVSGHLWKTSVEDALAAGIDILDHVATLLPRDGREVMNPGQLAQMWASFDRGWGLETVHAIRERHVLVSSTLGCNAYSWSVWKEFDQDLFNHVFFYHRFLRTDGMGGFFFNVFRKRMRGVASEMMSQTLGDWEIDPVMAHKAWQNLVWLARSLHAEGCLVPGSDAPSMGVPPGQGLVRELILLEELVGIPAIDALRLGTSRAAAAIGLERLGHVREGFEADLLLLDRDPLADIRNLESLTHVVIGGRLLAKDDIKLVNLFTPT